MVYEWFIILHWINLLNIIKLMEIFLNNSLFLPFWFYFCCWSSFDIKFSGWQVHVLLLLPFKFAMVFLSSLLDQSKMISDSKNCLLFQMHLLKFRLWKNSGEKNNLIWWKFCLQIDSSIKDDKSSIFDGEVMKERNGEQNRQFISSHILENLQQKFFFQRVKR